MSDQSKAKSIEPITTVQEPVPQAVAERKGFVRKTELIDMIVDQTGVKKKDVKLSVEAAFTLVAEMLSDRKDLHLPPLGKLKFVKSKDLDDGAKALTLKLRMSKPNEKAPATHSSGVE